MNYLNWKTSSWDENNEITTKINKIIKEKTPQEIAVLFRDTVLWCYPKGIETKEEKDAFKKAIDPRSEENKQISKAIEGIGKTIYGTR
jgi:hypothetical protein